MRSLPDTEVIIGEPCRTSAARVRAEGDCNGSGAFTHPAWNGHEIVVAHRLDGARRRIADGIPCLALSSDPAPGRSGIPDEEACAGGRKLLRSTVPMRRIGRAGEVGALPGFVKLLVGTDSQLLPGAASLGLHRDAVVQGLLDTMSAGQPHAATARAMPIRPTVIELVPQLPQRLKPMARPAASADPAGAGSPVAPRHSTERGQAKCQRYR